MTQVNEQGRRRRPSLADVASHAGVSQGAVSKVIRNAYGVSPAMQQRVQRAIDDLNYRPRTGARGMRGQTFTIAIGSEMPQLGNDFFTQVITGAAQELAGSGYQLIIAPALDGEGDQNVLDALVDRQVDGIVAISLEVTPGYLDRLAEYVPTVLVGRHDHGTHYDTVTNDDRAGVTLAMEHLFALGHREVTHLTVKTDSVPADSSTPHAIRQASYESHMLESGLRPQVVFSDASERSAYTAASLLLEEQVRPTAIFAGNDTLAVGALRAVAESGLSAAEVSVVGYDNVELASHPLVSLTTVDQYGVKTGATAVELLMQRIRHTPSAPRHVQLDPTLVIRNSSARRQ